jgi:hypothetical protein
MWRRALFALSCFSLATARPAAAAWPLAAELRMAADAASFAPPDFKRQLAKHRDKLMEGVRDAAVAETGKRDAAAHRAAAARGARELAAAIRRHTPFADVVYELGGVVHEIAMATGPPRLGEDAALEAAKRCVFRGFAAEPFADPETLVAVSLPTGDARAAWDTAITLDTRLIAWIWKAAGGDASIARQHPERAGPWVIRE